MNAEAETVLVIFVYVLLATCVALAVGIGYAVIWFRGYIEESLEFIRLMISLYENERNDGNKAD